MLVEHLGGFEGIGGLFPQRAAVNQEQDAAKTLGLEQSVNQRNSCFGFAGTGGHRQQDIVLAYNDGILYRADSFDLIRAQVKVEIKMLVSQLFFGLIQVLFEEILETLRAIPTVIHPTMVLRTAQVPEPDTRQLLVLVEIGAAIGGKRKGYPEYLAFWIQWVYCPTRTRKLDLSRVLDIAAVPLCLIDIPLNALGCLFSLHGGYGG